METTYGELLLGISEKYSDEIVVETSVDTSERGGAESVVSLEAEAKTVGVELVDGEAEVSGKVNYRLLYLDRQRRLCGLDYFKDFSCRIKGDAITPGGKWAADLLVPDAEAHVKGEEVTLSAMVDVSLTYYGEQKAKSVATISEAETLVSEITSERAFTKESTLELSKVADVNLGVKKILLFSAEALPVECKEVEGGTELSGEVSGTILYVNDAEEVTELKVSLPFGEAAEEDVRDAVAFVKTARVILTDDEEGGAVEVEATVVLRQVVYEQTAQSAIKACCGEKKLVEETSENFCGTFFVGRKVFSETLGGTVAVEREGDVAFVRPGCRAIAEVSVGKDEIKVEGVSAFQIVLQTEDGYVSEQGELPFVYVLPFDGAEENRTAEVAVKVTDAVGVARGKDVTVSAKVSLDVRLFEKKCFSYLSDVKEAGDIPESAAGISVYYAEKGEDVFSIAKKMGVLPSALVKANPFLTEPLEDNQRVLIFRQK